MRWKYFSLGTYLEVELLQHRSGYVWKLANWEKVVIGETKIAFHWYLLVLLDILREDFIIAVGQMKQM